MVPEDFIQRVRLSYPDMPGLLAAIENYDSRVARELFNDSCNFLLSPEQIIELLDKGRPEEVRSLAAAAVKRCQLYQEWEEKFSTIDE